MEKEKKKNCWPLAAESPSAAKFVLFVPSTRIFRTKVVHMMLGLPSARIFLSPCKQPLRIHLELIKELMKDNFALSKEIRCSFRSTADTTGSSDLLQMRYELTRFDDPPLTARLFVCPARFNLASVLLHFRAKFA